MMPKKRKATAKKSVTRSTARRVTASLSGLDLDNVRHDLTKNSKSILEYTHNSTGALLKAYGVVRATRAASRGMTTDDEQDLLRAMLVMAAAGLDGMAKQLIRDTLPTLVLHHADVREGLEKFVARQIRGDPESPDLTSGTKFLARILAAPVQQRQVIEEYIRELTGGSLQSVEELLKTAGAFGLAGHAIGIEPKAVRDIFAVRNKIIHELDIDLSGDRRKRNIRRQNDMIAWADTLLSIGAGLLRHVDEKLAQSAV